MLTLKRKFSLSDEAEDGFTLIELVIVVAVIGILTAIAIPTYGFIQKTARQNTLDQNALSIVTDFEVAVANGKDLTAIGEDGANTVAGNLRNSKYDNGNVAIFSTGNYAQCQVAVWLEGETEEEKLAYFGTLTALNTPALMKDASFDWGAIYYGPLDNPASSDIVKLDRDNYTDYC